ncbi:trypsin-like peptidase domain-containing protein [Kribbella sp. NPDC026611]|uniref:S1C family serine protease n=1 Tax=Kribbella sp. NPDC026611 TaxID=3154911 RepID=UPI0033E12486
MNEGAGQQGTPAGEQPQPPQGVQPQPPQYGGQQQPSAYGAPQAGPYYGGQQAGPYFGGQYGDGQYGGGQYSSGQYGGGQPPYGGFPPYGHPFTPPPPKRRGRRLFGAAALGMAAVLVAGSVAWGIDQRSGAHSSQLSQQAFDAASVAAKVSPGLVDVNTVLGFEGARAAGTGIVLTADGEILTNHHVIEGATSITVTDIGNGKTYSASVVGYDEAHDIAVLKLKDASGLQTAKTGNSDQVKLGDQVVGVGNAGGVGGAPSYAAGSVTGLNQAITATDENGQDPENLTNLIETNANIQAGDSGGPLVNANGEVVGVDVAGGNGNNGGQGRPGQTSATSGATSIASLAGWGDGNGNGFPGFNEGNGDQGNGPSDGQGNGNGQGGFGNSDGNGDGTGATTQGYAIPINQAIDIAHQIENGKSSSTVHIGASAMLGISVVTSEGTTGAVVGDVLADGKADDAGITAGDVITSFAGHTVDSPDTLSELLNKQHPGDKVEVGWTDQSGQSHKATIELITGPVR